MRRSFLLIVLVASASVLAQDRLHTMPRYDRYEKLRREIGGALQRGDLTVSWSEDGRSFFFAKGGKNYKYDIASRKAEETEERPPAAAGAGNRRRGGGQGNPARGRQFESATSPDGKLLAAYRDRNIFLSTDGGKTEKQITHGGNAEKRTKYGSASWVYGEELGVREAMWWSPDSTKLAYYGFDESEVQDYFLTLDVTKVQNRLDVEAYPKAGAANPKVSLFVYDIATGSAQRILVDWKEPDVAHYVYDVRWSPDGKELWFNRTNRKQNVMEFCAADPRSGACRVIIREEWPQSWTDNHPDIRLLEPEEGKPQRFLWASERNGFRNYYLYEASGKLINVVTQHPFEVGAIVRLDEKAGVLFYMARSGDNPYKLQLHRAGLDGKGDRRLTDPKFHHTIQLAPDGRHFVDTFETISTPPTTVLRDEAGKELASLATSDRTKFDELRLQPAERFEFLAADGKTKLYGYLHKPSDFDPGRRYPLLVSVYGGPDSGGGLERFATPNAITEFGFLVAWFDGRGTNGRGKAFKDALYGNLGVVEIDDQAAGVKFLAGRPYVDGSRVGVHGTSYGGYSAVMCILRHPDTFSVAVASSSVTDWLNYDTIYTERYMGLPWEGENKKGYDAGSAMQYARNLKGKLMLFYGTADNNVHPSNTYQLAAALNRAGKSYDMMAGPDQGHAGINQTRMWEYFIEHLILKPGVDPLARAWGKRRYALSRR